MKETVIKVTLFGESYSYKEWEQPSHPDLPALLRAVKFVKLSVNDYLTNLIDQHRDLSSRNQVDQTKHSESEEEIKDDISGFIKLVNGRNKYYKRKFNYFNQVKKVKK